MIKQKKKNESCINSNVKRVAFSYSPWLLHGVRVLTRARNSVCHVSPATLYLMASAILEHRRVPKFSDQISPVVTHTSSYIYICICNSLSVHTRSVCCLSPRRFASSLSHFIRFSPLDVLYRSLVIFFALFYINILNSRIHTVRHEYIRKSRGGGSSGNVAELL